MDWMSPLITSGLRLVVISLLFVANCVAVCRLFMFQKYKVASCCKWITIFTILILNLTYLSTIWAPFTITTFNYNLQDLQQSNSRQVQDNRPGKVLGETRYALLNDQKVEELHIINDRFHMNQYRRSENDFSSSGQGIHSRLSDSLDQYITTVQDLVTSSYTYTLVLLAFVRKIPSNQFINIGRLGLSISGLVYIVGPIGLSTADRMISDTTNHQFALHNSETPINGYTMFSIICDVNITLKYVVGVFLESMMILILGLMLLVVTHETAKCLQISGKEKEEEKNESQQIEDVAYKFVVLLGSIWAWPVKPVFVAMLLYFNGEHWNSVVCWLANMVVAVPVVFMPLAVLISRYEEPDYDAGYNVLCDPENAHDVTKKSQPRIEDRNEAKDGGCLSTMERVDKSRGESLTDADRNSGKKRTQARENLAFYLGTDIFKPKKEDEVCILSTQSLT